jgi:hypothetical protein
MAGTVLSAGINILFIKSYEKSGSKNFPLLCFYSTVEELLNDLSVQYVRLQEVLWRRKKTDNAEKKDKELWVLCVCVCVCVCMQRERERERERETE